MRKGKSLEKIAESVKRSIKFPEFETLRDFETKALKIAKKYDPGTEIQPALHGKGIRLIVKGKAIAVCKRQKGSEEVISRGVFDEAIDRISKVTGIPYNQLELYFLGSGKPYKLFKREFEKEYDL